MKVALTCGMDFSRPNGVTRYVEAVASGLARNHEVILLSADEPSSPLPVVVHLTPIRRFPWMKLEPEAGWLRSLLNAVQLTTRLLVNALWYRSLYGSLKKRHRVDIIHSQSLDSLLADVVTMHACYAAAWGRKKGEMHDLSLRRFLGYLLFMPFNQRSVAIERSILYRIQRVIAVSQEV
jgi:glycosyltransferase involved in cell wall biosynthesis